MHRDIRRKWNWAGSSLNSRNRVKKWVCHAAHSFFSFSFLNISGQEFVVLIKHNPGKLRTNCASVVWHIQCWQQGAFSSQTTPNMVLVASSVRRANHFLCILGLIIYRHLKFLCLLKTVTDVKRQHFWWDYYYYYYYSFCHLVFSFPCMKTLKGSLLVFIYDVVYAANMWHS